MITTHETLSSLFMAISKPRYCVMCEELATHNDPKTGEPVCDNPNCQEELIYANELPNGI